jgi:hypothetical protein
LQNVQYPSRYSLPSQDLLQVSDSVLTVVFVFSYGVVVFWNFTERQERDILADLTFASNSPPPSREGPKSIPSGIPSLAARTFSPPESTPLLADSADGHPTLEYGTQDSMYDTSTGQNISTGSDDMAMMDEKARTTGLMVRVLKEMDVQIEDFHFEYNPRTRSPRIRDDMITYLPLYSLDHVPSNHSLLY